jgi:hypothetical protein
MYSLLSLLLLLLLFSLHEHVLYGGCSFLESVQRPDLIWTNDEDKVRMKLDRWGEQGGLGWGHNMRLGTGLQLLDMVSNSNRFCIYYSQSH